MFRTISYITHNHSHIIRVSTPTPVSTLIHRLGLCDVLTTISSNHKEGRHHHSLSITARRWATSSSTTPTNTHSAGVNASDSTSADNEKKDKYVEMSESEIYNTTKYPKRVWKSSTTTFPHDNNNIHKDSNDNGAEQTIFQRVWRRSVDDTDLSSMRDVVNRIGAQVSTIAMKNQYHLVANFRRISFHYP